MTVEDEFVEIGGLLGGESVLSITGWKLAICMSISRDPTRWGNAALRRFPQIRSEASQPRITASRIASS